jgi:hypothetical protein
MSEMTTIMATITKRNGKYRVQIRRNGTPIGETFTQRRDAELFGKQKELVFAYFDRSFYETKS